MKSSFWFCCLFSLILPMSNEALAKGFFHKSSSEFFVTHCHDGDTCRLKTSDNLSIKVRLIGMDAPEVTYRRKKGQPFGKRSRDFINELIKGKKVTLKTYGLDVYGRNLAEIYLGSKNINVEMVTAGLAEIYYGKKDQGVNYIPYEKAQKTAKEEKRGIWSLEHYMSPKDWRHRKK